MCVIAYQPKTAHLEKDRAKRLWKKNSDGGGFAFINDDNRIVTYKSLDFDDFWRNFERARSDFPRRDFLVHMRIATHGSIGIPNTHPFPVDDYTVMAHNGIITQFAYGRWNKETEDDLSDTRRFIDWVLPEMPDDWLDNPMLRVLMEDYIGAGNKLAFLTNHPALQSNIYILNEDVGTWKDGMWFSNTAGVDPAPKSTYKGKRTTGTTYKVWDVATGEWKEKKVEPYADWKKKQQTKSTKKQDNESPDDSTDTEESGDEFDEPDGDEYISVIVNGETRQMLYADFMLYAEEKREARRDEIYEAFLTAEDQEFEQQYAIITQMEKDRKVHGFYQPLSYESSTDEYFCIGCDSPINLQSGACACWTKICNDCACFAAMCQCDGGISLDLTDAHEAPDETLYHATQAATDLYNHR